MRVLIFTSVKFAGVFFASLKYPGQFLSIGEVYKNKDVPKEVRKKVRLCMADLNLTAYII